MRRGSKLNRLLDFWVAIPLLQLLALPRRLRRPQLPAQIRRLGVLCSPALGDTLLFSAVLLDLRLHYPDAEIIHLCMRENLGAAELIASADRRVLLNLTRPWTGLRTLRELQLDLLVDFTPWQRITALHTLLSGARYTAGFQSPGQYRAAGYALAVPHRRDLHELENFRALVRALGVPTLAEPTVSVPELTPAGWADAWLAATQLAKMPEPAPLIVFHPWPAGAQFWLREWPQERWLELAKQLQAAHPAALFVVTGSPADQPRVAPLLAALSAAKIPATGFSAPMPALVALLRRSSLAVCVNTGILHLAAILGTPTVGLNGPTAGHRWGPRGRCAQGVSPADGSGGYLHFGYEHPPRPVDVMGRITVAQVLAAAAQVMRCAALQDPQLPCSKEAH